MADVKSDPMAEGVALDGAYLLGQAKEALDTFCAPVVGAFRGFTRHTRPGLTDAAHKHAVAPDLTQPPS
jgi:hypothetical protein